MSDKPIRGKVARVLSERELIVNVGSNAGVTPGMRFAVLGADLDVTDPDSGELIGQIERVKVRVEATEVQERLSICRTYETRTVGGRGAALALAMQRNVIQEMMAEPRREVPMTLKAKDSALPPPLSPEESYVKIGDPVKQILK